MENYLVIQNMPNKDSGQTARTCSYSLNLCWVHISEDMFSHVAAHVHYFIFVFFVYITIDCV